MNDKIFSLSGGTNKPRPSIMQFHRAHSGMRGRCVFCLHEMSRVIAYSRKDTREAARIVFMCDPCFEAVREILAISTWE